MTTPEIVRLERIVKELREELAARDEVSAKERKHLEELLANVTSELHGLTRRFENHYHGLRLYDGEPVPPIMEDSVSHLWDYNNEIESGRY